MLFNSLDFAVFFTIIFIGYWFIFNRNLTVQNAFLLLASYFFYACWDWRFLFLLFFSTITNFYFAQAISRQDLPNKRKTLLVIILCINLGLLGYFKYFNFFVGSFIDAFTIFGVQFSHGTYNIILPLGISFYTFQCISYVADVYRRHSEPVYDLLRFSLFTAFFPLLISGPIERKNHLMPQIEGKRLFDYSNSANAMRMILLGLFEKMVIADNCGAIVDSIFVDYAAQSGSTLFFTAIIYSFQIYGDFSGYSHIAIGCAGLLGFTLRDNFNYPYLAKNIADFWRRWHISFSSWLRDYIYFPLGGSKKGLLLQIRNLFIVFVISGLWHGANWTFIIYGSIHAALYIMYVLYKKWEKNNPYKLPSRLAVVSDLAAIAVTFMILTLARVYFRSPSVGEANDYLGLIFSGSLFEKPAVSRLFVLLLLLFVFLEYLQRDKRHLLDIVSIRSKGIRYTIYLLVVFMTIYYAGEAQSFVYFKF